MSLLLKLLKWSLIIFTILLSMNCISQNLDSVFVGNVLKGKEILASCYIVNESRYEIQFNNVLKAIKEKGFTMADVRQKYKVSKEVESLLTN